MSEQKIRHPETRLAKIIAARSAVCDSVARSFVYGLIAIVIAFGAYSLHLLNVLYSPASSELSLSSFQIDGDASLSDPNEIYTRLITARSRSAGVTSARDPNRPMWLLIDVAGSRIDPAEPVVYDIRSVAATDFKFWLVSVDRTEAPLDVTQGASISSGELYLKVPAQAYRYEILASIETPFPFRPKIIAWANTTPESLSKSFTKGGVAVWTLFLGLAFVTLMIAWVNRSYLFAIFGAWLIASLRVVGFNNGWDFNWLGADQWSVLGVMVLRTSIVVYALLSAILFKALFGEQANSLVLSHILRAVTLVFGVLIVFGHWIPLDAFMGVFRATAALGLLALGASTFRILRSTPSATAWLYAGSYAILIIGILLEILFQADLLGALNTFGLNATGASLASALVMTVALAAQIRDEKKARMQAQDGEIKALRALEGVYSRTPAGLFSITRDGSLITANSAFRRMFSLGKSDLQGDRVSALWEHGLLQMCEDLDGRTGATRREICLGENELQRWYIANLARSESGFDGSISDVTDRKAAEQQLEYVADHDAVSGALNMRRFESFVHSALSSGDLHVLGVISVDGYNFLQKIHGRHLAEQVVCKLHSTLSALLPDAKLARDHDKLYLLLSSERVSVIKAQLEEALSGMNVRGVSTGSVALLPDLSAGLCVLDSDDGGINDALLRVSLACEIAQASRTACVAVAEQHEVAIIRELESTRFAGGLDDHIKAGRFFLVAQPIVNIRQRAEKPSFELLLRMRGEGGEVIPPWQFIPAAEKMGVMSSLDRFVLKEAVRLVQSGEIDLGAINHLGVNLSGSSLNDLQFTNEIFDMVVGLEMDLHQFCFEVTESVALQSFERTKSVLNSLQEMGAKTAIDDFGAGHSSIHYVSELNPDYLKIDGSLISKVLTHPVHALFVEKLIEIADAIQVGVIGEFIETPEQEAKLFEMGLEHGQGYFYSTPMPVKSIPEFCANWAAKNCLNAVRHKSSAGEIREKE